MKSSTHHFVNINFSKSGLRAVVACMLLILMAGMQSFAAGPYYWIGGNNTSGSPGTFNTLANWNSILGGGGTTPSAFPTNTFIIDGKNVGGGTQGTTAYINLSASLATTKGPAAFQVQITAGGPASFAVVLGGSADTLSAGSSGNIAGITNAISVGASCTLTVGNGTTATTLQFNNGTNSTKNTATITGTLNVAAASILLLSQAQSGSATYVTVTGTLQNAGTLTNTSGTSTLINGILIMDLTGTFGGQSPKYSGGTLQYGLGDATTLTVGNNKEFPSSNGPMNLTINTTTTVTMGNSYSVPGTLTMTKGNISVGNNTLTLGSSTTITGTLSYTAGTIITGTNGGFDRYIASGVSSELFPVGTVANYNGLTVSFTSLTNGGQLTISFTGSDPLGRTPFPTDGNSFTVTHEFTQGYWSWSTGGAMSTNATFNLALVATGFTSPAPDATTRIMKATNTNNTWSFSGTHAAFNVDTAYRNGFTASSSSFILGLGYGDACVVPNGTNSFQAFGATSLTSTVVNFTPVTGSAAATGWVLLRSTSATAPTAPSIGVTPVPVTLPASSFPTAAFTAIDTGTTFGAQSYTDNALSANTTYYYWLLTYTSSSNSSPCWQYPAITAGTNLISTASCTLGTIVTTQFTGRVIQGTLAANLLKLALPVTGSAGTLQLNSLTLTSKNNSDADVTLAHLYTGTSAAPVTEIGGTGQAFSAGSVIYSGLTTNLSVGTTYLWIAYDVSATAVFGDTLDAKIVNPGDIVISNSGAATPTGSLPASPIDPAGSLIVSGVTLGTIVANQQTGLIGVGTAGVNILRLDFPTTKTGGTLTLDSLTVTSNNTNDADITNVYLYTGTTLGPVTQIGTTQAFTAGQAAFKGLSTNLPPNATTYIWVVYDISASATVGDLADAMINAGDILISAAGGATDPGSQPPSTLSPAGAITIQNLTLGTIVANQQTGSSTTGTDSLKILRLDFPVTSTTGTLTLTSLKVTSSNSHDADIAAVHLWSGTTTALTTEIGGGGIPFSGGSVTFSGLTTNLPAGTTYIWITYDIASTIALPSDTADAKIVAGGIVVTPGGGGTDPGSQPVTNLDPSGNITLCGPSTGTPWSDGFESITSPGAGVVPACWSLATPVSTPITSFSGTYSDPFGGTITPHSGNKMMIGWNNSNDWMFSPAFNLIPGGKYVFSYWYSTNSTGLSPWTLNVAYGSSATVAGMTTVIGTVTNPNSVGAWTQVSYPFTASGSGTTYLGIQSTNTVCCSGHCGLDDVNLILTCVSPSVPPTMNAVTNNNTGTSMTLNWTPGSGDRVLVMGRFTTTAAVPPSDGTAYTADTAFGSGPVTGAGNYVLYAGAGNTVNITGLFSATSYTFTVYAYNSAANCYQPTASSVTVGSYCTQPTVQAAIGAFTNGGTTVNWTRGNGSGGVIVVGRLYTTPAIDPISGTAYSSSTTFGSTTSGLDSTGAGNYVVFNGNNNNVTVSGLTGKYIFTVYEYHSGPCFATPGSVGTVTVYCIPGGGNCIEDIIDSVQIGTNGSVYKGPSTGCSNTSPGYSDQTAVTINLIQGVTYPFHITTNAINNSNDNCGIWIDFNDNGVFTDAGEFLGDYLVTSSVKAYNGNLIIPGNAPAGNHRMRLRGVSSAFNTAWTSSNTACESITWGEAQDYTVNIAAPCITPTLTSTVTNTSCIGNHDGVIALATTGGSSPFSYFWSNGPATQNDSNLTAGTYTVTVTATGGCTTSTTATVTDNNIACAVNFTVKFFIQGYYLDAGKMSPLLNLLGVSPNPTDVDTATIQLRVPSNPAMVAYSVTGIVQNNGGLSLTLPLSVNGQYYYIVVNHRNSLQTWSADSVQLSRNGTYDFTTAAGQAYHSNMVNLGGGVYGIYSGDINQDGAINASDKTSIQSTLPLFRIGLYNPGDLTGDGFADEDDYRIVLNNISLNITVQHP